MKKAKVNIFTDLNNKIKVKASNNQEAEKRLFAQMIVIAECSNLQIGEVLAHLLGPVPRTLAKPDGRCVRQASLAKELQNISQPADVVPQPSACLIDGLALVQRLKSAQKTFA